MNRTEAQWKETYLDNGAFYEHDGTSCAAHPILTSGLHSDVFFNSRPLLKLDDLLNEAAWDLVEIMKNAQVPLISINRIVGPQTGGTKLSTFMSRAITNHTGAPCGWASPAKHEEDNVKSMVWEDTSNIVLPGEEVMPCDDVLSTGGSVGLTRSAIELRGGKSLPYLAVLVNRSGLQNVDGARVFALINRKANAWPRNVCPLCKMGSRAIEKTQRQLGGTHPPPLVKGTPMRSLITQQRLVIAIDLKPDIGLSPEARIADLWVQAVNSIRDFANLGVTLKFNSLARLFGHRLTEVAKTFGVEVFLDFKLIDIDETMRIDGMILAGLKPRFVTCMAQNSDTALIGLKTELPLTNVIAVSVLTSLDEEDCDDLYHQTIKQATLKFGQTAKRTRLDGMVASAKDAPMLRKELGDGFLIITPAIRPAWSIVKGDDQNQDRSMTPAEAIEAGADVIVVGRPIRDAANRRDAAKRTLDEIASAIR